MSVTFVPVERGMHKNKNGNETYVEECFLKPFGQKGDIVHRETIAFSTVLHLIIYPKQCPRSS